MEVDVDVVNLVNVCDQSLEQINNGIQCCSETISNSMSLFTTLMS